MSALLRMRGGRVLLWTLPLFFFGCGSGTRQSPSLVVVLSVDQLRADLLERYDPLFTGGLRRLLDRGRVYLRATHDHAATATAPGHATLATGVHPSRHGIVGNTWLEEDGGEWRLVYNVRDTAERIVGVPSAPGVSPRRLLRDGLADWIVAADPRSRVFSVAGKDRSAVLMAGRSRGEVYWFSGRNGRFVTSTYYRSEYPSWVERFHREALTRLAVDSVWRSTVPDPGKALSRPDTSAYEGDGVHTHFPHRFSEEGEGMGASDFFRWIERTPFLDRLTLEFARAAVEELGLGADEAVDLLAVGLSQTDRVGHDYGPLSREQLDNLLRLDRELGEFLRFLDGTVGPDRYVVALSADHGVLTIPEHLREMGGPGRRITSEEREALLTAAREAWEGGEAGDGPARVAAALRALEFVADAYPLPALVEGEPPDSFAVLFRNAYRPGRAAGILARFGVAVRLPEGSLLSGRPRGTSHGSPYLYDRHVPLIFMGPGIDPGKVEERAATVDLAPTLARLAGVPFPDDLDGRPLLP